MFGMGEKALPKPTSFSWYGMRPARPLPTREGPVSGLRFYHFPLSVLTRIIGVIPSSQAVKGLLLSPNTIGSTRTAEERTVSTVFSHSLELSWAAFQMIMRNRSWRNGSVSFGRRRTANIKRSIKRVRPLAQRIKKRPKDFSDISSVANGNLHVYGVGSIYCRNMRNTPASYFPCATQ